MSGQPETATFVTLGGTTCLTAQLGDGSTVEISLSVGDRRATALRAHTDADGELLAFSARSWALNGAEPELARTVRSALNAARAQYGT
jgi:hypothetical protein